jgi:hypothetical protein
LQKIALDNRRLYLNKQYGATELLCGFVPILTLNAASKKDSHSLTPALKSTRQCTQKMSGVNWRGHFISLKIKQQ